MFSCLVFFIPHPPTTVIYTLSLHDALPISIVPRVTARLETVGPPTRATIEISPAAPVAVSAEGGRVLVRIEADRSEEHTSELQSPCNLVCRLLLEKKKQR